MVATARGVSGRNTYTPGTTSEVDYSQSNKRWVQFRATVERYKPLRGDRRAWGYFMELTASGQGTFSTYRSSLTTAPVFAPLPDSRTMFLDNYSSARYVAAGLRYTQPLFGPVEWRTEVFTHLNFQPLTQNEFQRAERHKGVSRPYITASTGVIFQTPVGPLAIHARFYDDAAARFGVYGHLGYLLFRGRALE